MLVRLRFKTLSVSNPSRNLSGTSSKGQLPCSSSVETSGHCIKQLGRLFIWLFMKETLLREFENSPTEISLKQNPERTRDLHPSSDDDVIHIATSQTTS